MPKVSRKLNKRSRDATIANTAGHVRALAQQVVGLARRVSVLERVAESVEQAAMAHAPDPDAFKATVLAELESRGLVVEEVEEVSPEVEEVSPEVEEVS